MTELETALNDLVPAPIEFGDWNDVLERAGVHAKRAATPVPRRRGRLAVALVVVLLLAPAAIVAAVLTRTDVIFSSAKPAPNIVKKEFLDLGFGAPPQFAPQPLAAQAREVGTFQFGGKPHKLWVAPTRGGGYCWTFERAFTGCFSKRSERRPMSAGYMANNPYRPVAVTRIDGTVDGRETTRIRVHYADGATTDVPFVFVSAPISAGFFVYEVPQDHRSSATHATSIVALDRAGRELGRQTFDYAYHPRPKPHFKPGRYVPRTLPTAPRTPPSDPQQRATAGGVSVVAGANGVVVFDATSADAHTRSLLRRPSATYLCFKLVREFGIFDVKGLGFDGRAAPNVAIRLFGMEPPFDGCEIQGSYGHRWPDRNESHSAAELAFTEKGRRYFVDRAAARDLSLFVRSRDVHRIRRESGAALARGLARYPIVHDRTPPPGKIGWIETANGVTFVERSPTGRRFYVEVRNGKIVRSNVKPYAFVF